MIAPCYDAPTSVDLDQLPEFETYLAAIQAGTKPDQLYNPRPPPG